MRSMSTTSAGVSRESSVALEALACIPCSADGVGERLMTRKLRIPAVSAKSVIAGELDARALSPRVSDTGAAELLLDSAMRSLAATGVTYVTLGLSPLSRYSQWPRGGA